MRNARKAKQTPELHPLSAAVKRIRLVAGWSQERMARETNIATQTISRFELGKQVPRDYDVLRRLRDAAADAGLSVEEGLFEEALAKHPSAPPPEYEPKTPDWLLQPTYTPHEWRLMQTARIAVKFFPQTVSAIEQAAIAALAIVDDAMAGADPNDWTLPSYHNLEPLLDQMARQRVFAGFKKDNQK